MKTILFAAAVAAASLVSVPGAGAHNLGDAYVRAGWQDDSNQRRWEHFYHWRMRVHWEHDGPRWGDLPPHVQRHIIEREWYSMQANWRE